MGCECHQIGGPFIAEDPNCEVHRDGGLQDQVNELRDQVSELRTELERYKKAFHAAHTCSMDECDTACAYL